MDLDTPARGIDFDRPVARTGTASFKWDMYGDGVLPLWVADMDFASPPPVVAALTERAAHGVYGYALVPDSMVEAIRAHLAAHYGWAIEPEWLVWLPSVVPGLNLCCRAFADPDDEVMAITPVYPPFLEAPPDQGRRLLTVEATRADGRWQLPLAAMEAAVTPRTRVLLFCHPHNPLGRVWNRDELAAVLDFCRRHDLILCSDEIHCDLLLDDVGHVPAILAADEAGEGGASADAALADARARTVTLYSPSKTFNLPGLNFAFAVIPDAELRRRFEEPGRGILPWPGCFAVAATEAAYRDGGEWLAALLDYLRGNRDLVERFVAEELPGVTTTHVEATYLSWLDVRGLGLKDPAKACVRCGVALSDGAHFGTPGFLRLNFACPRATLEEGLRRVKRGLLGE